MANEMRTTAPFTRVRFTRPVHRPGHINVIGCDLGPRVIVKGRDGAFEVWNVPTFTAYINSSERATSPSAYYLVRVRPDDDNDSMFLARVLRYAEPAHKARTVKAEFLAEMNRLAMQTTTDPALAQAVAALIASDPANTWGNAAAVVLADQAAFGVVPEIMHAPATAPDAGVIIKCCHCGQPATNVDILVGMFVSMPVKNGLVVGSTEAKALSQIKTEGDLGVFDALVFCHECGGKFTPLRYNWTDDGTLRLAMKGGTDVVPSTSSPAD